MKNQFWLVLPFCLSSYAFAQSTPLSTSNSDENDVVDQPLLVVKDDVTNISAPLQE